MTASNHHTAHDEGVDFGHEFHGHEHHFRVTREALEFLAHRTGLDEAGMVGAYNANLARIHALAQKLSRTSDGQARILIERSALD